MVVLDVWEEAFGEAALGEGGVGYSGGVGDGDYEEGVDHDGFEEFAVKEGVEHSLDATGWAVEACHELDGAFGHEDAGGWIDKKVKGRHSCKDDNRYCGYDCFSVHVDARMRVFYYEGGSKVPLHVIPDLLRNLGRNTN